MRPVSFIILSLLIVAVSGNTETWIVAQDGSGDATTIQDGVRSAASGDSVLISPGSYMGSVDLHRGVSLIGVAGAGSTILDSAGATSCAVVRAGAPTLIQGLTLTRSNQSYGYAAIRVESELEIRECIIENNFDLHGAVYGPSWAYCPLRIFDTRFTDNAAGDLHQYGPGAVQYGGPSLQIERCTFDEHVYGLFQIEGGDFVFRDNLVKRNVNWSMFKFVGNSYFPVRALVERNVFVDNSPVDFVAYYGPSEVEVVGNTFVRSGVYCSLLSGWSFRQNLIVGGHGFSTRDPLPGYDLSCNNVWSRSVNYGGLPDPTGVDGNISQPPLMCDPPGGDFTLAGNSPCLPGNNPCGVLIGARDLGCEPISVTPESWARVKARYR